MTRKVLLRTVAWGAVAAGAAMVAGGAAAQTPAQGDSRVLRGLEEIVVTAERREESQQAVPVAVTTLSEGLLERQQIRSIAALDQVVPNIVMNPNTGTSSASKIFLRGVGEDESFFTADTPVGIYVDDVYIARQTGAMFDLFDIERLEVLRGPQGTLYGRNTSAGAVKLVSKKPQLGEYRAQVDATIGSYDLREFRASANVPVGDMVAFQIAALSKIRDGYTTNIFNNTAVNDQDVQGVRASILVQPADTFSVLLVADAIREDSTPGYPTPLTIDRSTPIARPTGLPALGDYFLTNSDIDAPQNNLDQNGVSATLSWDATDTLALKSVTALREMSNLLYLDADGNTLRPPTPGVVPPSRFHLFQDQIQWQASQEFQANGTALDGRLQYVAGAFWFFEWNDQQTKSVVGIPALSTLPIALAGRFDLTNTVDETLKTTSWAGYGSASYDVTDKLAVTVGLRWTEETKRYTNAVFLPTGQQQIVCLGPTGLVQVAAAACTPAQTAAGNFTFVNGSGFEATWNDWTPRFVVDYQWTDDILTYVSAAKGFKGGTTSGRTSSATENFARLIGDPETNWSYEAGLKADWLDGRLRTNVAAFYNEYKGLQFGVSLPSGGFGRINAGDATIQGLEVEATAVPVDGLEIYGSLGLLEGEYDSWSASLATCAAQGLTTLDQLLSLDLKQAPDWSYRVGFNYSYDAGSTGVFSIGADYSAKDDHFNNLCNSRGIAVTDYEFMNAQASWESPNGNWLIQVAGKNITDSEVFNGGFDFAQSLGFAAAYMYPPAIYTVSVRYRF